MSGEVFKKREVPVENPACDPEAVRAQLDRILNTPKFVASERLTKFLAFVLTQYLDGQEDRLQEFGIGIDVFGKPDTFDASQNSTVRATASRLRTELAAYYAGEGKNDPILIDLPKGHYVPRITARPLESPVAPDSATALPLNQVVLARSAWSRWRWEVVSGSLIVLVIAALLVARPRTPSAVASFSPPPSGRLLAWSTSEGHQPIRVNIGHEIGSLLVTPDGKELFAVQLYGRTVTVLGVDDLLVKRTFHLPYDTRGAVMARDGKRLYVGSPDNVVMVVGTHDGHVEKVIPTGGPVFDLVVTPDDQKLFLAMGNDGLKRISLDSGEAEKLSKFACPMYLAMDTQGGRLFVSYQCGGPMGRRGHDVLEIYDTASEQRVGAVHGPPMVGGQPVVSPDGDLVLLDGLDACVAKTYDRIGCPDGSSHIFHLVRLSDLTVVKTFSRPVHTYGATFSPDGSRLIFGGPPALAVLDWAKETVTEYLPSAESPGRIVFTPSGDRAFVPSTEGGSGLRVFRREEGDCWQSPQGLANHYSGDGTLSDSTGAASLVASHGMQFSPGLIGQAFHFTGADAFLDADRGAACPSCSDAWTESFFIKFDSTEKEMTLIERAVKSDRWRHRLFKRRDNRIVLQVGPDSRPSQTSSNLEVKRDTWYHVAVVATRERRSLYLDGVLQGQLNLGERTNNLHPAAARGHVWIGASRDGEAGFRGLMDEVSWYERALTADEIRTLATSRTRSACRL